LKEGVNMFKPLERGVERKEKDDVDE